MRPVAFLFHEVLYGSGFWSRDGKRHYGHFWLAGIGVVAIVAVAVAAVYALVRFMIW